MCKFCLKKQIFCKNRLNIAIKCAIIVKRKDGGIRLQHKIEFPGRAVLSITREVDVKNNMPRCHSHDRAELYFLTDGVRCLFAGGRLFMLRAGDLLLVPPGVEHRTIDIDGLAYSKLICMLPVSVLPGTLSGFSDIRIVRAEEKDREELYSLLPVLTSGSDAERMSAVFGMLAITLRLSECRERVSSLPLGRMSDILLYIEEHFAEKITLTALSERFYISEFYLCRLFKEYAGRTLISYLTSLRVERAKQLLATTDMSVERVAALSGFGSVSSLGKAFRTSLGLSPRDYRVSGSGREI